MKKYILVSLSFLLIISCKEETSKKLNPVTDNLEHVIKKDTLKDIVKKQKPSYAALKDSLQTKGFETFFYIDPKTNDTILMQKYFMVFLKRGTVVNQNEEETQRLQKAHLAHLTNMYEAGYADISGPFENSGVFRGITIYNVPNLKMADSLARLDPMVKSGRLNVEVHAWWAAKGFMLR